MDENATGLSFLVFCIDEIILNTKLRTIKEGNRRIMVRFPPVTEVSELKSKKEKWRFLLNGQRNSGNIGKFYKWITCVDDKTYMSTHSISGLKMMFRVFKLIGSQWKAHRFAVHWFSSLLPGACKAVQQEEEAEVIPTVPSPSFSPLLPNTSTFQISPPLTPGTPVTPSAPSPVEGPGSSECVVCMETGVRKALSKTRK